MKDDDDDELFYSSFTDEPLDELYRYDTLEITQYMVCMYK
jgi:hypothetical protein